jgi:hypothetical protein
MPKKQKATQNRSLYVFLTAVKKKGIFISDKPIVCYNQCLRKHIYFNFFLFSYLFFSSNSHFDHFFLKKKILNTILNQLSIL